MTDRELLELAAKAAGIKVRWDEYHQCYFRDEPDADGISGPFIPLDDDGDSFRLAVKLDINIRFGYCLDDAPVVFVSNYLIENEMVFENFPNPTKATRRAIVRAAAEIGKGMK